MAEMPAHGPGSAATQRCWRHQTPWNQKQGLLKACGRWPCHHSRKTGTDVCGNGQLMESSSEQQKPTVGRVNAES